jgi:thiol-disulfide isomerase/thioredoxin
MNRVRLVALLLIGVSASPAPAASEIGEKVADFAFKDIRYLPRSLDDLGEQKAYVLVATSTTCPLVQRYLPRLAELDKAYAGQGVQFLAVNVGPEDSIMDMAEQAIEYDVPFHFVKDIDNAAIKALGLTRTPEVVVLDAERKLRYRGRIDDQYRLGGVKPEVTRSDLKEAIDDVLAGQDVEVATTPVDGCKITLAELKTSEKQLTYASDIAPLIKQNCQECHRPGTETPFSLLTYDDVAKRAEMIAEVVSEERMPPWFASPHHGQFVNARGLTADERAAIVQWANGDKAKGDLAKAPEPLGPQESPWLIGEPDLVISVEEPFELKAEGYIKYQYRFFPHEFKEDTWIQGAQIMPSNLRVVHHCNLYITNGKAFTGAQFITGKVPGGMPMMIEPGMAFLIPKGSVLGVQIHYTTTGKPETDTISLGLRFARGKIQKRLKNLVVGDYGFAIPPGAPAHTVTGSKTLDTDATGLAMFSHMHLRGKDMTFLAHYPDGKSEKLLIVPNYSFDWQLAYLWDYGKKKFPKGTRFECVAHFDNSKFNAYNPDPTETVKYGPQTYHEMMFGFFFFTDDAENLDFQVDPKTGVDLAKLDADKAQAQR